MIVKIKSLCYGTAYFTDTACALHIELNGYGRVLLGKVDAFQINIAVCSSTARFGNTLNGYLLNKSLIVRLHRVQTVNHVVNAV